MVPYSPTANALLPSAASGAMISFGPVACPAFCAADVLVRLATPTVPIMVPSPDR